MFTRAIRWIALWGAVFCCSSALLAQGSPNVPLIANVNDYPTVGYNDCWGYTAPDGREYALLGVESGTSIIDITDSTNVHEVAFIPSNFSIWKDIKTYQHYAYTVTEASSGLQIIDLSDLPNSATLVNTYNGFGSMHNIYIDTQSAMLYASPGRSQNPCLAISLADPVNPLQVSTFGNHNHDSYARNGRVYLSEGFNGSIGIYDLSNPLVPDFVARFTIPAAGYVHNSWLTDDGNYLMTTEETPGKTVKMWDIRNPQNVTLASEYVGPNHFAHNTHIKGDFAYISHYESGLRIVDISNPDSIFEVGFYDTQEDWGAFPFFDSGKILISDEVNGLYVVFFAGAVVTPPVGIPDEPAVPRDFFVSANYPNPFNPSTTIDYRLSRPARVKLIIYNTLGQTVRTLVDGELPAGSYRAVWDGRSNNGTSAASGMYLYRFSADGFTEIHKMVLLR